MKQHKCYKKIGILIIALISCFSAFAYEDGIRIAWDFQTAQKVTNGVYARVHAINNNQFALVYSDGPDVWIRTSSDQCKNWSNQIQVHHENGYNNTNAELVRLANGWLVYAWNGRPLTEHTVPYIIKTKISKDNGQTWGDERLIYAADNTFENGCWEPSLMQIPSGEVQLFFANENPYRTNFDQEISMYRSFDNGLTWGNFTTTSYRGGFRDGMPVPIRLNNNKGMVYCIEDNGLNGNFKPSIIYSSNADNWGQGPALWNSSRRWGALRNDYALPSAAYAGAPYITQLPSGETLLSIQSSEGRTSGDQALVEVYIGTDEAKNFARKSTPLPWIPAAGNTLWNSLVVINDSTVLLTTSANTAGAGPGGIWTIRGRVIKPMNAPKASMTIDGIANEPKWNAASSVFLGSQSASNMNAKIAYDDQNLYILCDVKDNNLWAESPTVAWDDDGIEVYLDPKNKNCNGICDGMYKLLFNIGGGVLFDKVNTSNAWESWTPQNVNVKYKTNGTLNSNSGSDVGYVMEVAIPWNQIGGKPQENNGWGIHFKLHDDDDGGAAEFHEDLSGNDPNKASTYMKASLDFGGNGTGIPGFYHTGENFENFKFCRIDNNINFNWGNGSPDARIPNDGFSVKWKGSIQVPVSGEYTFYITSDNGRRLTINNSLVIDKWINDWDTEYSGKITLQAGIKYPIVLDYFEDAGGANIVFQWSHAQIPKEIVPIDFLYADDCGCAGGVAGVATLDTDKDGTPDCTDTDDDNDGVLDTDDCAPLDPLIKGKTTWYADTDGDGFGDPAVTQMSCTKPTGYVADKTDACPADANKKAAGNCGCGKTEQSCLDCAGVANGTAKIDACSTCVGGTTGKTTLDTDKDGTPDCTDTDDDNDGVLDADDCAPLDPLIKGKTTWYADTDGDGFGDPLVTQLSCTKPTGYVADKTDACPTDANKKVAGNCGCGKTEQSCLDCAGVAGGTAKVDACGVCTGGTTGKITLDTDKDGTPDCTDTDDDNDGVLDADDCAPLDPLIKGKTIWYADADGDGFGDPAVTQMACAKPAGYVADKTDACPADANKKAAGNCGCGKTEQSCLDCAGVANGTAKLDVCGVCTGGTTGKTTLDTDKDGTADCVDTDDDNDGVLDADDCAPLDATIKDKSTWYEDTDGDGFGDPSSTLLACTKPAGYVADKTDACPADPNKKAAGNCGCNKVEGSCLDCAGIANGTAVLDNCQICVGGTTGKTACTKDCAGVANGTAVLDDCQTCVGGTTGKTACTKDCHGDWGGTASVDVCNICSGGNTGITPKTNLSQCVATDITAAKTSLIKVYPNPFEDRIEITGIEEGQLEIFDASGKIVQRMTVTGDASISLSEYASGMYLMKYSTDDLQYQKVIIKK